MSKSTAVVMLAVLATGLGTACRRAVDPPKAETPSLNVTDWTEKTELYMEYPPLVAGRTALFAVHLTKLAQLAPVDQRFAGRVGSRINICRECCEVGPPLLAIIRSTGLTWAWGWRRAAGGRRHRRALARASWRSSRGSSSWRHRRQFGEP